jgi:type III pantothenate kinase
MSLLLVNVGNTCTTIARTGRADAIVVLGRQVGGYCARPRQTSRLVSDWATRHRINDAVLCSVVPAQTRFWVSILKDLFGRPPLVIGPDIELDVTLAYPRPETIGSDRLADVCAAVRLYGAPVLVVDIGTAATFNMVRAGGRFVGGAIAPGPALFTRYLADRTAQLPLVALPSRRVPRIGQNTRDAIRLAASVGYRGMVTAMIAHILGGAKGRVRVVVTGGYARRVMGRETYRCILDPLLTLRGLAFAYSLNRMELPSRARGGG